MKLNDALWGMLLLVLGGAVLIHVQSFPHIPGQNVGPGLFPGLVAAGLGVCGAILLVRGWRTHLAGGEGSPWIWIAPWLRSPPHVLAFAVLAGVNVLYLLAVDRLGFVITGAIYLAALMWVLRVRRLLILPLAITLTLGIHYSFYKLLKVPLPWGVLQSFAW